MGILLALLGFKKGHDRRLGVPHDFVKNSTNREIAGDPSVSENWTPYLQLIVARRWPNYGKKNPPPWRRAKMMPKKRRILNRDEGPKTGLTRRWGIPRDLVGIRGKIAGGPSVYKMGPRFR